MRNLALDARRRRAFESRLFAPDETDAAQRIASDTPSAHARAEAPTNSPMSWSRLPPPGSTRQAFLLHRVEGLTLVEVGMRLGLSKSLVHELVVLGAGALPNRSAARTLTAVIIFFRKNCGIVRRPDNERKNFGHSTGKTQVP